MHATPRHTPSGAHFHSSGQTFRRYRGARGCDHVAGWTATGAADRGGRRYRTQRPAGPTRPGPGDDAAGGWHATPGGGKRTRPGPGGSGPTAGGGHCPRPRDSPRVAGAGALHAAPPAPPPFRKCPRMTPHPTTNPTARRSRSRKRCRRRRHGGGTAPGREDPLLIGRARPWIDRRLAAAFSGVPASAGYFISRTQFLPGVSQSSFTMGRWAMVR